MARLTPVFDGVVLDAGCCPAGTALSPPEGALSEDRTAPHLSAYVRRDATGRSSISLIVPDIVCAACIAHVERAASSVDGVDTARVNFSTKRLTVSWQGSTEIADDIATAVADAGYRSAPFSIQTEDDGSMRFLLRALGVAGFAAMNIMLLSVSVWAGIDMAPGTQALFHWLSALIALPTVAYAGQPFFRSALGALRARHLNMDVPISLAVILAAGMSLFQTIRHGDAVYFDASVMLLFFLLLGRVLDLRVRARARSAAQQLLALRTTAATVIEDDGTRRYLPPEALRPGMRIVVPAGERIPADGVIENSAGAIDNSILTGESKPEDVASGDKIFAGALNLTAPLEILVTAAEADTLLAEIVRLMEDAEQGRARYVRLADRMARFYAPAVHLLGALTLAGWLFHGAGWEISLLNAIAVLIITCPCALALAVPAVQVAAGGRLLRNGVLIKSGDALERLANIDTVVFDKTGTLTTGQLKLAGPVDQQRLAEAAALARDSLHPLARAVVKAAQGSVLDLPSLSVTEHPGLGLASGTMRLGNRKWVGAPAREMQDSNAEIWLRDTQGALTRFAFTDTLRRDTANVMAALRDMGLAVEILSGDRPSAVAAIASAVGVTDWAGACAPSDKVRKLQNLAAQGRRVLMVGDGLNDAPALAAAHVSMSPANAADVAQNAADFVLLGENLSSVAETLRTARAAKRLVFQNFALAFAYNAVAVPIAMLGFATPLLAAAAMSASSLAVTLNALRLKWIS